MLKSKKIQLTVLTIMAVVTLIAFTLATSAQTDTTLKIEVAGNGLSYVQQAQPVNDDGLPLNGNPFIIRGYLYPEGTLTGTNGVLEDGSPEFPDAVIGTWICSGFFYGESLSAETGPYAVTTQIFEFGDVETGMNSIMSHGYEMIDIDLAFHRAVTGGTGDYAGANGVQTQTYLGDNPTIGPNFTIEFALE